MGASAGAEFTVFMHASWVPVVAIDGQGFYLLSVPARPRIVSWGAYDIGGHKVDRGSGAPDAGR